MTALPASRLTIHWVSPLPPAETDIAHYTARLLPALCAEAEVILWTDQPSWDSALDRFCKVRYLDPDTVSPRDFSAARRGAGPEIVFIHIGNSWVFHSGLLRLALRLPAIVVLHDMAIQELMLEAIRNGEWSTSTYLAGMGNWYGAEGKRAAQACLGGTESGAKLSRTMPGFELAMEVARGVLTHTDISYDAVKARLPHLPCAQLPLPYKIGPFPPKDRPRFGPLRLLQFGWIGPNRRLEQILDALAQMGDNFDYRLDVMGKLWDIDRFYDKVAILGLEKRVYLHGFVSEEVLDDALRQAHLVLNLRHPSMGEASGSQLRIWNAGAASVVTRAGWYADLPKETTYIIDQEHEISQLQALFRSLADNRTALASIGNAGRMYLETHHTPEFYAEQLLDLAQAVISDAGNVMKWRSFSALALRSHLCEQQRSRFAQIRFCS